MPWPTTNDYYEAVHGAAAVSREIRTVRSLQAGRPNHMPTDGPRVGVSLHNLFLE